MAPTHILVSSVAVTLALFVPLDLRAQCCNSSSGCFCDLGGTIKDTCTGLQWEKKTTAVGSGLNAADLHDVDNVYTWVGQCTVGGAYCQPNTAAAATCAAHADGGTQGCNTCVSGTCNIPFQAGAITTVWDWLNQVNAANFAGHNDWRLPSEMGHNYPYTGAKELETILAPDPCGIPCINSIFGPTVWNDSYWSASTLDSNAEGAWIVYFYGGGGVDGIYKFSGNAVRAVR